MNSNTEKYEFCITSGSTRVGITAEPGGPFVIMSVADPCDWCGYMPSTANVSLVDAILFEVDWNANSASFVFEAHSGDIELMAFSPSLLSAPERKVIAKAMLGLAYERSRALWKLAKKRKSAEEIRNFNVELQANPLVG